MDGWWAVGKGLAIFAPLFSWYLILVFRQRKLNCLQTFTSPVDLLSPPPPIFIFSMFTSKLNIESLFFVFSSCQDG